MGRGTETQKAINRIMIYALKRYGQQIAGLVGNAKENAVMDRTRLFASNTPRGLSNEAIFHAFDFITGLLCYIWSI